MGKINKKLLAVALLAVACVFLCACSADGGATDPGQWGYDCCVTYDALGGLISAKETRTTYFAKDSYAFEPMGLANLLVEPSKDGYMLAGWYTAKEDILDANGNVTGYSFKPEDHWDFELDRIQGDMTLYARWVEAGFVEYVDADTGDVIFAKKLTADSPMQPLSDSVLKYAMPAGKTFIGYFEDEACTVPFDFTKYTHVELHADKKAFYDAFAAEFPQYLQTTDGASLENDEASGSSYFRLSDGTCYRQFFTDGEGLAILKERQDALIDETIDAYVENTANKKIYMKFWGGNFIVINSPETLDSGSGAVLSGVDSMGKQIDGYILANDIDMKGKRFTISEEFSGTFYGNGHKISNIEIYAAGKKFDDGEEKFAGITRVMKDALWQDVTFENVMISLSYESGTPVTAGLLAGSAENVTLEKCHFSNISIVPGKNYDGQTEYALGDLFGTSKNVELTDCTYDGFDTSKFENASLSLLLAEAPAGAPAEAPADDATPVVGG